MPSDNSDQTPEQPQRVSEQSDAQRKERLKWAYTIGEEGFEWQTDLSENAREVFLVILEDMGLPEYLSEWAKREGVDLEAGLAELRHHGLIDETNPHLITVRKRDFS